MPGVVDKTPASLRLPKARNEQHMQPIKIVVEKHLNGYVAYPLGIKGAVVGEGETYEEALADVKSAVQFHIETFSQDVLEMGDSTAGGHEAR